MAIGMVGVSHETAPVEVRERFAFADDEAVEFLRAMRESGAREAVMLSTCNRTEVYLHPVMDRALLDEARRLLAEKAGALTRPVDRYLFRFAEREAVSHLFRVSAGLDSLVLGEAEIQGQVKHAFGVADAEGDPRLVGPVLSRLFQSAFSVGGRVRAETTLGHGAASVASVTVELARKIFGSLSSRGVMVLGAGANAELVVEAFRREGVEDVAVVNRSVERAEELAARLNGRALGLRELSSGLRDVDVVVASTAAPHHVLRPAAFREAFPDGRRRPLLIIDIAIPRDVDPVLSEEPEVFLYNIDDLRQIIDDTLSRRTRAVEAAQAIIERHTEEFMAWYAGRAVVPVIRSLRDQAESVRDAELSRLMGRLPKLPPDQRREVEEFAQRLLNKFLHLPTVRLREGAATGKAEPLVDALRFLHGLDDPDAPSGPRLEVSSGEPNEDVEAEPGPGDERGSESA